MLSNDYCFSYNYCQRALPFNVLNILLYSDKSEKVSRLPINLISPSLDAGFASSIIIHSLVTVQYNAYSKTFTFLHRVPVIVLCEALNSTAPRLEVFKEYIALALVEYRHLYQKHKRENQFFRFSRRVSSVK